jgi:hypothetical protein
MPANIAMIIAVTLVTMAGLCAILCGCYAIWKLTA